MIFLFLDNTFPEEKDCEVWLEEQKRLEAFEYEQIEKSNIEENRKWMEAEVVAIKRWNALQLKKEQLHQLHLQKEAQRKLVTYVFTVLSCCPPDKSLIQIQN